MGRPQSKIISWFFGITAALALTGTAYGAAEIRIEPTTLYFGAAGPSARASAGAPEAWEGLPAPGIRPEVLQSLREKAVEQREVRVLVRLAVPFAPEGYRGSEAVQEQRLAIGRAQDAVLKKLEKERVKLHARYEYIPFLALEVGAAALDRLAAMPEVNGLEADVLDKPALASSTAVIGTGVAWANGWTGEGQVIAVLDTGVDKTHPFFSSGPQNKVVSEACYSSNVLNNSTSVCPGGVEESTALGSGVPCTNIFGDCDHGTRVAGIAAGDDGTGPGFGVGRGADLIAIQVFSSGCGGGGFCLVSWVSDQIKGLERVYALAGELDIAAVNLSLDGGFTYFSRSSCDADNVARKAAIDNLRSIDIPTIAASGNSGSSNGISAPACISSAISVGATDDEDEVLSFSNVASFLDLMAPGASIDSPVPGGGISSFTGTSVAAPHVAGAWAVLKQANPTATVTGILSLLRDSAVPVRRFGHDLRRINLGRAVGEPLELDQLTIHNDGNAVLSVLSMQLQAPAPWIRWSPEAPFDVPPGGSKAVRVSVDFGGAPAGSSMNRLLVVSNDADESPYPGGVFLEIDKQACYPLTRTRTGLGSHPMPGLASSPGCPVGQYHAGQLIPLSVQPPIGSAFVAWSGTNNDSSTALTNSVTMPAAPHTVSAAYQILCYALTRTHTGSGADPVASPASSPGCPAGQYHYAERIDLAASPARSWRVGSWINTDEDASRALTNTLSMPASALTAAVNYLEGLPGVLLVNASFGFGDVSAFTQAIQDAGRVYDVWDVSILGDPGAATLAAYPRVVWYPGVYGGLSAAQENTVAAYLNGGGNLFLSASDYIYRFGFTPFIQNYLGVGSYIQDVSYYDVTGQGPAFSGFGPYSLTFTAYSDELSPASGAEPAFRWDDPVFGGSGDAGVSKAGPTYRTTFLGFPFEALPTAEDRRDVMGVALDFIGTVFEDVPLGHWAKPWAEALYRNGVTQGCGTSPRYYCPDGLASRETAAVLLLRSKENLGYTPPPCTVAPFNDVPANSPFCPWIQEIANRGITSGCGNGDFCPSSPVTREQMAFFLLKTLEGPGYTPPGCTETPFPDVPVGSFFCPWIRELAQRGFTSGCGNGNYCPGDSVNRAQIATFLVRTFDLPLF